MGWSARGESESGGALGRNLCIFSGGAGMDNEEEKEAEEAVRKEADRKMRAKRLEEKIDRNLEDSFPASDPPEWVLGVDRSA